MLRRAYRPQLADIVQLAAFQIASNNKSYRLKIQRQNTIIKVLRVIPAFVPQYQAENLLPASSGALKAKVLIILILFGFIIIPRAFE